MNRLRSTLIVVLTALCLWAAVSSCKKDNNSPAVAQGPAATFTALVPAVGRADTTVTLKGSNFATSSTANSVSFGGVPATIIASTPNVLTVKVPKGVATGVQLVQVLVNGNTAGTAKFTVLAPPPGAFVPLPAAAITGVSITLKGSNFDLTPANNLVKFGATPATVTAVDFSASLLTVTVPTGLPLGPYDISVTTSTGTYTASQAFSVVQLQVNGVYPMAALAGTVVKVGGKNFSTDPTANTVLFGGKAGEVLGVMGDSIRVKVPIIPKGIVTVSVKVGVNTADLPNGFRVIPFPPDLSPNSFPVQIVPGGYFVVSGHNFDLNILTDKVSVAGIPLVVTLTRDLSAFNQPDQIITQGAPASLTAGFYDLAVTSEGGTTVVKNAIQIIPPTITRLSTSATRVGRTVFVNGTFSNLAADTKLFLGANPVTVSGFASYGFYFTVPSLPTGTYPLTVTCGTLTNQENLTFTIQ